MNKHMLQSGTARFDEAKLRTCASLLASPPMQRLYRQSVETLDAARVACADALTDALIPDIDDVEGLLAAAVADPSLLSDDPEGYDHTNALSPTALLYENLYRSVFAWTESSLGEIVRLATLIQRVQDEAGADRPDAILNGE